MLRRALRHHRQQWRHWCGLPEVGPRQQARQDCPEAGAGSNWAGASHALL
jgi:hypothetical protein